MKKYYVFYFFLIITFFLCACAPNDSNEDVSVLNNTSWVLKSFNGIMPLTPSKTTIQFMGDQVSGNAGCNTFGGQYSEDGDSLIFNDLYNTEMACMEPEGIMEQEQIFLSILREASNFEVDGDDLTILTAEQASLAFTVLDGSTQVEPVEVVDPDTTVEITNEEVEAPVESPTELPPNGYVLYVDPSAEVGFYYPETWFVTQVIEGDYAILQSYPEDKYIGGEPMDPKDTKCDFNIQPEIKNVEEMIEQWRSDPMATIVSETTVQLRSGGSATRIEMESMGSSLIYVAEINQRLVLFTCFGNFEEVDIIASTLQ